MKLEYYVLGILIVAAGLYLANAIGRAGRIRRRTFVRFASLRSATMYIEGEIKMFELKEGQKVTVTVEPKTAHGHAGGIQAGSGRWSSSDESVVSVEVDPANDLSATIHGLDGSHNESVVLEFRADADAGEGVREVVGVASVVCTAGDATTFGLAFGTAVDEADNPEAVANSPANDAGSGVTGSGSSFDAMPAPPAGDLGRGDNISSDPSLGAPNPDGTPGDPVTTNASVPGDGNVSAKEGDDFDQRPDQDDVMTFDEAAAKAAEQTDTPPGMPADPLAGKI